MKSIAEIMLTPEYKQMMNAHSHSKFDLIPKELIIFEEDDIRLVHEPENSYSPYSLVKRSTYPRCYGTIDTENKNTYKDKQLVSVLVKYVVGICKTPMNDSDSDWEHLANFEPSELDQALKLLWDNREKALQSW